MISFFIIKFIMWVLIVYGITQILVDSFIFEKFRNKILNKSKFYGKMLLCMMCTGVWVSFFISCAIWSPSHTIFHADIVDYHTLTILHTNSIQPVESIKSLATYSIYNFYLIYNKFKFIFYDGMIGSVMVWFLYLIELKLSYTKK